MTFDRRSGPRVEMLLVVLVVVGIESGVYLHDLSESGWYRFGKLSLYLIGRVGGYM